MKINQDIVPSTIERAVDHIVESLADEEKRDIRFASSQDSLCAGHHTVGRYIRNEWSLWEPDSPLKRNAVETYGIAHADDISGLIIEWVFAKIKRREFDPIKHVQIYHEHWVAAGTDSLKAGGWPPL